MISTTIASPSSAPFFLLKIAAPPLSIPEGPPPVTHHQHPPPGACPPQLSLPPPSATPHRPPAAGGPEPPVAPNSAIVVAPPELQRLLALASSYDHIFFGFGRFADAPFNALAFALHLSDLQHEFRSDAVFENAEAHAALFAWSADLCSADCASLSRLGSIEAVITEKHAVRKLSGFNPAIVDTLFSSDPSYSVLRDIAENGAHVDTALDFVRIAPGIQDRPITSAIPKALGYHAAKLLAKQRAVLLPVECL